MTPVWHLRRQYYCTYSGGRISACILSIRISSLAMASITSFAGSLFAAFDVVLAALVLDDEFGVGVIVEASAGTPRYLKVRNGVGAMLTSFNAVDILS
jgi:hypothetical protein